MPSAEQWGQLEKRKKTRWKKKRTRSQTNNTRSENHETLAFNPLCCQRIYPTKSPRSKLKSNPCPRKWPSSTSIHGYHLFLIQSPNKSKAFELRLYHCHPCWPCVALGLLLLGFLSAPLALLGVLPEPMCLEVSLRCRQRIMNPDPHKTRSFETRQPGSRPPLTCFGFLGGLFTVCSVASTLQSKPVKWRAAR